QDRQRRGGRRRQRGARHRRRRRAGRRERGWSCASRNRNHSPGEPEDMSTSPLGGVTLYDPADLETDEPVDTVLVRDEIVGSALHLADEAGQVRVSWVALPGDPLEIDEVRSSSGLLVANAWYPFP